MATSPTPDTEVIQPPKTLAMAATEQESARLSLIDKMRDYFQAQKARGEYVRVKVRNDADVPVQINGYTFIIQHDVPVDVPPDVRDALEEADYI